MLSVTAIKKKKHAITIRIRGFGLSLIARYLPKAYIPALSAPAHHRLTHCVSNFLVNGCIRKGCVVKIYLM